MSTADVISRPALLDTPDMDAIIESYEERNFQQSPHLIIHEIKDGVVHCLAHEFNRRDFAIINDFLQYTGQCMNGEDAVEGGLRAYIEFLNPSAVTRMDDASDTMTYVHERWPDSLVKIDRASGRKEKRKIASFRQMEMLNATDILHMYGVMGCAECKEEYWSKSIAGYGHRGKVGGSFDFQCEHGIMETRNEKALEECQMSDC